MILDLASAITRDVKVPTDWEQSFIVCLYMGKGDALDRGNYRGLKLSRPRRSWRGLLMLLMTPSSALSRAEALQMQSLLAGS